MLAKLTTKLVAAIAAALAIFAIGAAGALASSTDPSNGNLLGWASEPARGIGLQGPCPAVTDALSPGGRFTAIYRVQRPYDVELFGRAIANTPGRFPVRERDIVMVRARGEVAHWADSVVDRLTDTSLLSGELLRCNRIMSLTGVRTDQAVPREYAYKLAHDSRVWAVVPDWEQLFWDDAYGNANPRWSGDYTTNRNRIRQRVRGIDTYQKPSGIAVTGWRHRGPNAWNYGSLHKETGLDMQIVQLQEECQTSPYRFVERARGIIGQYRRAGLRISKLSVEISFSANPRATALPHDVTPSRAANCTREAYAAGLRSFMLWAPPTDLDEYYAALPDYIRK